MIAQITAGTAFTPTTSFFGLAAEDAVIMAPATVRAGDVCVVGYASDIVYGTNDKVESFKISLDHEYNAITAAGSMTNQAIVDEAGVAAKMTEAAWAVSLQGAAGKSAVEIAEDAGLIEVPDSSDICRLFGSGIGALTADQAEVMIQAGTAFEGLQAYDSIEVGGFIIIAADSHSVGAGEIYVLGYCRSYSDVTASVTVDPDRLWAVRTSEEGVPVDQIDIGADLLLASLRGRDGQDGQDGSDGQDGHTPVKGTDYWTAADQAAMVQDVLDALNDADSTSY